MATQAERELLNRPGMPIGNGMEIRWVEIAKLKEQDVNAQFMQPTKFERLTENIREKGMIESLPYVYDPGDGNLEIVSGHHRTRAARNAKISVIPAIVDTDPMSDAEKASKQISHNALVGQTDQEILAELLKTVQTDVDSLLRTGLDADMLPTVEKMPAPVAAPGTDFDFRTISFTFLPHQLRDMQDLIDSVPSTDLVGVAEMEQYDSFTKAIASYVRVKDVRHIGTVIALLTKIALEEVDSHVDPDEDEDAE